VKEVVPFEEHWFAIDASQCICETVPEIQSRFVAAFPEQHKSLSGKSGLRHGDWFYSNRELAQESIEHCASDFVTVSVNIDRCLYVTCYGQANDIGVGDGLGKSQCIGFCQENGKERGRIKDQAGIPSSS
jgi:hypothetical protein